MEEADHENEAEAPPEVRTEFSAEWAYWARMPGWRPDEAAALLVGIDPDKVQLAANSTVPQNKELVYRVSRLAKLLDRACEMDELEDPVRPKEFVGWCKSNDLAVPPELRESVKRGMIVDWRVVARKRAKRIKSLMMTLSGKEENLGLDGINTKSKISLLTILLVIAEKKYNYDVTTNNSAASQIATDIATAGFLGPKDQTVRDWLNDAHELTEGRRDDKYPEI
ncbi:MAG: hypothetical protein V7704_02265 [Aurantimonas endophytica]|uniref:hypothetical protein n=1 Tax=Aurantimonas endophytica TaxID=1522175 RepID=UPI003002A442